MNTKHLKGFERRKLRVKNKIRRSSRKIILTVFRSSKYFYAQLIDSEKGKTLISVSEGKLLKKDGEKITKSEKARLLGALIAERAKKMKIGNVVFDRRSYKYHGRVKAFAEEARKGGLQF